jgi:acyl-CoA thioester hydrolase
VTAPHEHLVQLRWSDPDSLGHVNHARALSLLEDARLAMANGTQGDAGLILARLEVDYLRQLYYRTGERLCVRSVVTRLGRSPSPSARN